MKICSKCRGEHDRDGRYCADCHAAYMRHWRRLNPIEGEAKARDTARSYANSYLKRGLIAKLACQACGSPESEMHHPDHELPRHVIWLCRPCHLAWHSHCRASIKRLFAEWLEAGHGRNSKAA